MGGGIDRGRPNRFRKVFHEHRLEPAIGRNDWKDRSRDMAARRLVSWWMVQAYHEIHQTVLARFGGSICGEHGDGRVRAEYVRTMFGQELYTCSCK